MASLEAEVKATLDRNLDMEKFKKRAEEADVPTWSLVLMEQIALQQSVLITLAREIDRLRT